MLIDYLCHFGNAVKVCEEFEEHIVKLFFNAGQEQESSIPNFVWTKMYRNYFRPVKACIQLCTTLKLQSFREYEDSFYKAASQLENPREIKTLKDFRLNIGMVKACLEMSKDETMAFCSAFDEEEKERINEAIHNHLEGCCYSCVAMSVSAAESRLLKLMCLASPTSKQELERKTLGQLIYEYINNKDKYGNAVPEKHEALLQLSNTYRTFSVHPKRQRITRRITDSILHLSIEFLTDQDTRPEVVKAQLVASEGAK